jgi:hypothetical protein
VAKELMKELSVTITEELEEITDVGDGGPDRRGVEDGHDGRASGGGD